MLFFSSFRYGFSRVSFGFYFGLILHGLGEMMSLCMLVLAVDFFFCCHLLGWLIHCSIWPLHLPIIDFMKGRWKLCDLSSFECKTETQFKSSGQHLLSQGCPIHASMQSHKPQISTDLALNSSIPGFCHYYNQLNVLITIIAPLGVFCLWDRIIILIYTISKHVENDVPRIRVVNRVMSSFR